MSPNNQQLSFEWPTQVEQINDTARIVEIAVETVCEADRSYNIGHPWHYMNCGDNAEPPAVEGIPTGPFYAEIAAGWRIPRNPKKRREALLERLEEENRELAKDIARYQEIVVRGVESLSQYDREIAYGGNDELARASSIALKCNHITFHKTRIAWIERNLQRGHSTGFGR